MTDTKSGYLFKFKGGERLVTRQDILNASSRQPPKRVNSYFVEVNGKRYPVKQLLELASGADSTLFYTDAARRALEALEFEIGKVP
jgi:5-methylcytosine-specific restriction protein B